MVGKAWEGHQEMFFRVFFVSLGWVLLMKNYTLKSLYWFLKSVQTMAHDKLWTKWSFFELIPVTLSFLVYTHVCACVRVCTCVCYVCTYVCTCRGQKRMLDIMLYHALPYSLEKGFFNLSGSMLVNSLTKQSSCLCLPPPHKGRVTGLWPWP